MGTNQSISVDVLFGFFDFLEDTLRMIFNATFSRDGSRAAYLMKHYHIRGEARKKKLRLPLIKA